jgi:NADPH:quinone reductase-like Zn-dependent oxidoreductase
MKAVRFDAYGDPDVLHLADVPEPHAGPGQVRVAVRAAGINPVDWKIRSGASQAAFPIPLPHIPGMEVAGVVDEVGEGVTGTAVGDEVFGAALGASAQFAVADVWQPKPARMSWPEAAGIPMAVETAARGLGLLDLAAGQTLLVNGASGGVGLAAVQLALGRGLTVIGTAGPANLEFLESLGVRATTYGPGLVERAVTLGVGQVDGALAVAGVGALPELITLTGSPDRVVSIGDGTAPELGIRFTTGADGRAFEGLAEAAQLFEQGRFTMPVAGSWPLSRLADAHRQSETGHVRGKYVVEVDPAES